MIDNWPDWHVKEKYEVVDAEKKLARVKIQPIKVCNA